MLTAGGYQAWIDASGLTPEAGALIARIRAAPPSRRVRSGSGNVPCRYPSAKMGRTIQAESHTVELPFVHAAERDQAVLEYWDQPGPIRLRYPSKHGRTVTIAHTPDFFVLWRTSAGWVECKPEARLHQLARDAPNRYQRDEQGQWQCPPGAAFAAQYGLTYRLFSSAAVNWAAQRNWAFLADYFRADCPAVPAATLARILALVTAEPGVTLAQLQHKVREVATADDLNLLVASGQLYVDLSTYVLAEPDAVPVFCDVHVAQAYGTLQRAPSPCSTGLPRLVDVAAGTRVLWEGHWWTLGQPSATHVPLLADQGTPVVLPMPLFEAAVRDGRLVGAAHEPAPPLTAEGNARFAGASVTQLAEANRRYALIRPHLEDGVSLDACGDGVSRRTRFDWARKWRAAEVCYGHGYLGLLPATQHERSRRLLTEDHLAVLHQVLETHYATYRHKCLRRAFGPFLAACAERGLSVVSERTFYMAAHRALTTYQTQRARGGKRAAYPYQPPQAAPGSGYARHGDRPWDLAHLDHTELDVELVSSRTGRLLGRPWLTLLLDACSRRICALYLSFAPPSYVSCMMALRLCVERWGRLPQAMVVDGGPEFHSTYFEALLAWYRVTMKTRPPAEPRYGSIGERLFGTANTTFIHTLLGNTQLLRQTRQLTAAVDPRRHACWTLGDLYPFLGEWAFEVYDTIDHPALEQSPRAAYQRAEDRSGTRAHTRIAYDRDFIIRTLPTTRKGTAKVTAGRGVLVNHLLYWCSAFDDPEIEGTSVAVRYDPFDIGTAYAYLTKGHRWVECRSSYYAHLQGRSARELLLLTAEVRKARRDQGAAYPITARQLAAFSARTDVHEVLLRQRERDAESRALLGGTSAGTIAGASQPLTAADARPATVPSARVAANQPVPKILPRLR